MALLSTALAFAAAGLGPDDFTIIIPVRPETPEGQQLIAARARQICGSRYPIGGRYRFTGDERIGPQGERASSFEVRQELTCSDTPPSMPTGERAPDDWRPTQQDISDVVALTERYFAAIDGGDAETAHGMWSESEQEQISVGTRRSQIEEFRQQAGARRAEPRLHLTWYVNPQTAPRPGIYVAVDYEQSYANLALNCGYLIWYREGAARYRLIRQENSVTARSANPPSPEELARIRQVSRCPA